VKKRDNFKRKIRIDRDQLHTRLQVVRRSIRAVPFHFFFQHISKIFIQLIKMH